jgi:hypothetical protein
VITFEHYFFLVRRKEDNILFNVLYTREVYNRRIPTLILLVRSDGFHRTTAASASWPNRGC